MCAYLQEFETTGTPQIIMQSNTKTLYMMVQIPNLVQSEHTGWQELKLQGHLSVLNTE